MKVPKTPKPPSLRSAVNLPGLRVRQFEDSTARIEGPGGRVLQALGPARPEFPGPIQTPTGVPHDRLLAPLWGSRSGVGVGDIPSRANVTPTGVPRQRLPFKGMKYRSVMRQA